ncbi:DUF402 domain-containing protein [Acholeplasma equirhinis]|uniref:DUF402 domain-containing protein n=1 Tax=Acholeplasma equirhinis TaxID=555393 RepID=UPI00197A98CB|nr:DUF402 domain-containing protein [Acholeplasma equirhinis]MBN3490725.1 DUF402 domain-containing protein [Acholeplasma equirhinis]
MKLKSGKKLQIHSYKHDSSLHRVWTSSFVIDDTASHLVTGNQATKVIESDGRSWYTKEPAICYFYEKEWFNIIAMLKKDGIHYYCNISSPYLYDGEAIKYIDYDLDVKVFPTGKHFVLDQKDYDEHSALMNYPEDVQKIILKAMEDLKVWIKEERPPFDKRTVKMHYEQFKVILEKYKARQQSKNKFKSDEE